jgi:hypothetical protein
MRRCHPGKEHERDRRDQSDGVSSQSLGDKGRHGVLPAEHPVEVEQGDRAIHGRNHAATLLEW